MMSDVKWSETRLHDGSDECPVGADEIVRFNWADSTGTLASCWDWKSIIAYQVQIKPEPLFEYWVNVYPKGGLSGMTFETEAEAERFCGPTGRTILMREVRK